jgi:hypothetical protein
VRAGRTGGRNQDSKFDEEDPEIKTGEFQIPKL